MVGVGARKVRNDVGGVHHRHHAFHALPCRRAKVGEATRERLGEGDVLKGRLIGRTHTQVCETFAARIRIGAELHWHREGLVSTEHFDDGNVAWLVLMHQSNELVG